MTKLIAYKAFNKDWTCRDFRYVVGKSYKHEGDIELCERGFHACENPLDVLNYYDLTESKFAIVEVNRVKKQKGEESKIVSADIYIKAEIALPEFIKNSVNYLIDITKGKASSGDSAKQASSGYGAKQASSGDSAKHICEGEKSVIASSGRNTKAKGIKGTWIALAEYKYGECVGFATGCIGKKGLKPDTWYEARNGKLVEPLEKEISVEDMQKIVDANEKLVKEMKDGSK